MLNFMLSFVIAFVAALAPWPAFSKDIDFTRADELIKKYNTNVERPKSCPMESKKFVDMIAKTEAIKSVLKDNCLQKNNDKSTEILTSIQNLQDELRTNTTNTNAGAVANALGDAVGINVSQETTNSSLTGVKFSALFSNLSTLFKKNQCNLEDGRVLQTTADLIYDSTQLGILSGSSFGLMVAGGGFLLSSALRLIDLIFKQRFNFEKTADRQAFVKLNCSFYDIRRELDVTGALDIENNTSKEDFRDIKAISEEVLAEIKAIDDEKANLGKAYSDIDKAVFAQNVADLTDFKKLLAKIQKYLQAGINGTLEVPSETQKLLMIAQLSQDYDQLVTSISYYKTLKISSIPMLDDLLIQEMKQFDSLDVVKFNETMNIAAKDFNENHRAKILFHIMRISNDIASKENSLADKSQKAKDERGKFLDKRRDELAKKLVEIKKVESRLGNVVAPKEYTGLDDGSDNMVSIIENHNQISSQLYGEWGEKFLKYATYQSVDEVKDFNERYKAFNKRYAEVIKSGKAPNLSSSYLCQDAQKLRLMFKRADSLVQDGFDFIVTNKDIIHSDVKNYYNQNLNESEGYVTLGPVEKVQRHYKSAVFALRSLKGETLPDEVVTRYLTKNYGSFFIGKSMIEVSQTKAKARNIQDIYEKLGCQKSLADDLGN